MRYLRMFSNALAAAAVGAVYLSVLFLQLNPAVPLYPMNLVALALTLAFSYGVHLVVGFYAAIVLREMVAGEPLSPGLGQPAAAVVAARRGRRAGRDADVVQPRVVRPGAQHRDLPADGGRRGRPHRVRVHVPRRGARALLVRPAARARRRELRQPRARRVAGPAARRARSRQARAAGLAAARHRREPRPPGRGRARPAHRSRWRVARLPVRPRCSRAGCRTSGRSSTAELRCTSRRSGRRSRTRSGRRWPPASCRRRPGCVRRRDTACPRSPSRWTCCPTAASPRAWCSSVSCPLGRTRRRPCAPVRSGASSDRPASPRASSTGPSRIPRQPLRGYLVSDQFYRPGAASLEPEDPVREPEGRASAVAVSIQPPELFDEARAAGRPGHVQPGSAARGARAHRPTAHAAAGRAVRHRPDVRVRGAVAPGQDGTGLRGGALPRTGRRGPPLPALRDGRGISATCCPDERRLYGQVLESAYVRVDAHHRPGPRRRWAPTTCCSSCRDSAWSR